MKTKFGILFLILVALTACGGSEATHRALGVTAQATAAPTAQAQPCASCAAQFTGSVETAASESDTLFDTAPAAQSGPSQYQSVHNPNHSIVDAVMTTGVKAGTYAPVDNISDFNPHSEMIYIVVTTRDTAPGSLVSVRWIARDVEGEQPDTFITDSRVNAEGSLNIAFSLKRNANQPWAKGAYRVEVYEDNEPDGTIDFTVGSATAKPPAQAPAAPVITRVVPFQKLDANGDPIPNNGEYPADTDHLAAAVYVDTHAPVTVIGVWTALNVETIPANTKIFERTATADPNNNVLLFSISTQNGQPLPQGAYKLDLMMQNQLAHSVNFRVGSAVSQPAPPTAPASGGGAMQFTYKGKLDVTPAWLTPAALALAPNGDLYVAEGGAVRRVKQDLSSARFGEMGIAQGDGKLGPVVAGIAADSQSNLWVANPQHSNIQKFSADGKFLLRFPGDDSQTYDKDGEFNQAYGIAVDKQNNVYIADTLNNRIQKFDANGKFLAKWTNLGLKSPIGIAADAQGNVYLTDTGNARVLKVNPQGAVVMQFGKQGAGDGEFNAPWGIALDATGNIYVTDNFNHRVQVFDANGKFLTKFGSQGAGQGQFDKPVGILVAPSGNVYVADGGNNSVQIFAPASSGASTPAPNNNVVAPGKGRMVANLGFRPNRDGFGFENYGGSYPQQMSEIFVEDLIRMFGEQVVCAGFKDGDCQVAPGALEWADSLNQASNSGHCEGMAVLSLLFYQGHETEQQYGSARVFDLNLTNQELRRAIMYYFAHQGANPVVRAKAQAVAKTPSEVLDDIIAGIQQRDPTIVAIRHYEPNGDRVGHAVAPYAVEDMGNGLYYVWIYDNNYPGQERYIEVDRNANTWKYGFAAIHPSTDPNPWGGDADSHLFGATRVSLRAGRAECPWCNDHAQTDTDAMTQVALLGGGSLLVTNSQGKRIGWVDGEFVNEIPGALDFTIDGGLGKPSVPMYWLPARDEYEMALDGSALTQSIDAELFVFGGGKSLNIDNITLAPGETNALILDGALNTFRYDPESAEDAEITLTIDGAEDDFYFAFDGLDIDIGEALTFTFDETDGTLALDSDNGSGDDTYALTLKRIGDDGTQIYENEDIGFGEDDTEYIDYDGWDGEEDLEIGIDENDDGRIDKEWQEENER